MHSVLFLVVTLPDRVIHKKYAAEVKQTVVSSKKKYARLWITNRKKKEEENALVSSYTLYKNKREILW